MIDHSGHSMLVPGQRESCKSNDSRRQAPTDRSRFANPRTPGPCRREQRKQLASGIIFSDAVEIVLH
jgi:hypothetical protein